MVQIAIVEYLTTTNNARLTAQFVASVPVDQAANPSDLQEQPRNDPAGPTQSTILNYFGRQT